MTRIWLPTAARRPGLLVAPRVDIIGAQAGCWEASGQIRGFSTSEMLAATEKKNDFMGFIVQINSGFIVGLC